MIGSNLITEQFIGANQKIFNYGDLIFTAVQSREPTEGNDDNSQCLATAHTRCAMTGSNTITFNRADVASRLTDHPHIGSSDNPVALTRDLAFRLGLYLDDHDLSELDLSPVSEPTEMTFAPKADAFAVYGSVTVTKHPPGVLTRTTGEFAEPQDGSQAHPFQVELGKIYEFPFSRVATLTGLEGVAYPFYSGERPGVSPAYANHGLSVFERDGKWWVQLYAPLIFNAGALNSVTTQSVNFSFTDPAQQGSFITESVAPTENTVTVDGATLVMCKGTLGDPLVLARGASAIIPIEYIAQVEMPEKKLSGITCTVDGIVGAICVTHMTGGVALGLPSDIYVRVTNNIDGDPQSGTITFANNLTNGSTNNSTLSFTFE